MQVCVLGMHRSRTSLVTGLIRMMGVHVGPAGRRLPTSLDNRKGYFERWDVMAINDELLQACGCSWSAVERWPRHPPPPAADISMRIHGLVAELNRHQPWVIKDPRLCLTFPYWTMHLSAAVPVVVSRDPRQIARSLAARDGMPFDRALALWQSYTIALLGGLGDSARIHMRAEQVMAKPLEAIRSLQQELTSHGVTGLRAPADTEVLGFVDPSLDHSADSRDLPPLADEHARLLAALGN